MTAPRKKAWITRREKYGDRGHRGAYKWHHDYRIERMQEALIRLHVEEVLSEGQIMKITGLDRIEVRRLADEMMDQ